MGASDPGTVGIIYTGGTFGMVPSEHGYQPSNDLPARVDAALAEGTHDALPALRWLEHDAGPPINSSDITPAFWYRLAETIRAHRDVHRGFVIIHGTDTLAYTGAALSFLLADLDRPVIVTGARAPLGENNSDALANLAGALQAAADGERCECLVAFAGRLLRANRTSKRYGSREHVFASPNEDPVGHFDSGLQWTSVAPPPGGALPRATEHTREVVLLPIFPGIRGDLVRGLVDRGVAAILLEAYPAGVGPGGDADFVDAIRAATHAGVLVAAVPQSQHGSIQLGRYASSTPLAEAGILTGGDMTREAALAKLHWLLGTGLDPDAVARRFMQNLRGELAAPV